VAITIVSIAVVQSAHWYRVLTNPLPVRATPVVIGQLVLFVSRLAFIIAGACSRWCFSDTCWRSTSRKRGAATFGEGSSSFAVLSSVFCFTTELKRLGLALRGEDRTDDEP